MKTSFLAGAAFVAAALSVGTASAATLTINESTDFGDRSSIATSVGTLAAGANSILGKIGASCGLSESGSCLEYSGDKVDWVSFAIPEGYAASAANLTISNLVRPDSFIMFFIAVGQGSFGSLFINAAGTFDVLETKGATGAQRFGVELVLSNVSDSRASLVSFDWRLDLTVSQIVTAPPPAVIPLPAGLPLLLTALGGLAFLRRRRTR